MSRVIILSYAVPVEDPQIVGQGDAGCFGLRFRARTSLSGACPLGAGGCGPGRRSGSNRGSSAIFRLVVGRAPWPAATPWLACSGVVHDQAVNQGSNGNAP